jgi:hypothetical protein
MSWPLAGSLAQILSARNKIMIELVLHCTYLNSGHHRPFPAKLGIELAGHY